MITRTIVAFALCLAAADASAARKEFSASRSETVSAKVKKVDQKTRMVTLVGEDGSEESFKASEEVRNLKQVKKGDVVTVMVDQSLSLWLLAKDEVAPELAAGSDVYRAKPGEKPGSLIAADVSGVATVEAIAADKTKVTLKGPRGNLLDLAVRNPANLDGVVVGDRVGFAYTETVAISVDPGKKKK